MYFKDLENKKIAILGLGIENYALVKYLLKYKIKCEITICDAREKIGIILNLPKQKNIHWRVGKNFNKNLDKFDILFRSPGWPIDCPGIQEGLNAKTILSSAISLFFDLCPTKNIIGVTGTKGKGTTASLIYEILKTADKKVWLGGNIGIAPFSFLDRVRRDDWIVLELSSFQLEDMQTSPYIAVITNFYPEHLVAADPNNPNFHKTVEDYWHAKRNIFLWQNKNDRAIINKKLEVRIKKEKLKSLVKYFKKSDLPSKLVGEHNKENIAAAVEVAKITGVTPVIIKKAVSNFKGLEHRLELVKIIKGARYYDDSFATTPEATITALESFNQPIILLLGGAEKGSNFEKLAHLVKQKVKFIVLLQGEATLRFKKELLKAGFFEEKIILTKSIKEAVKQARSNSVPGDIVLLSTACASFGMFKNYKERGDLFKSEVKKLL